jgi:hypothetical protein
VRTRQRLGDVLLQRELVTQEQLDEALARHRASGRRPGEMLRFADSPNNLCLRMKGIR